MKLGVMQPYFFPYIGYFQLIHVVDQFVILDDVQWINRGWINRNRILVQGKPSYITLHLQKGTRSLNINERKLSHTNETQQIKNLRKIEFAYKKAPYFESVFQLVNRCFACQEQNVFKFILNSLHQCCAYLNIDTPFTLSSELNKGSNLKGAEMILDINRIMGASHYINPIGGVELYDKANFTERKIHLSFIKSHNVQYKQFSHHDFVPFLSIIDVMMFNSREKTKYLLDQYDLC